MKYLIRKDVLGPVPEIHITQKRYLEFVGARHVLSNCLAIEQKYEILITNYIDFEKQILDATASYMVRNHLDYPELFEVNLGLNIRLVNLLTAARLYIDQLPQNTRDTLPNDTGVVDKIQELFSREYDHHREYRFMEALRNYVQHRGIPVHWTQHERNLTSIDKDGLVEYTMKVASLRSYLEEDKNFKKTVLDEIDEKVDLQYATRCYIECIGMVHFAARRMIKNSANTSRKLLEDAHKKYAEVYSESLIGLSACAWDDEKQVHSVPLLLDWDDIRLQLINRNRDLTNLSKRFVTGQGKGL